MNMFQEIQAIYYIYNGKKVSLTCYFSLKGGSKNFKLTFT
jgi:hypothetical protein